jgi:hypothetical protein
LQQYGAFGSGKNSGLNNAVAASAQGLGQNLAARREGMQQDAISQLLGLNNSFMGMRDYEHGYLQRPESSTSKFLSKGLPAIASLASNFIPGGGSLSSLLQMLLGNNNQG